ncbi:alpha/beta hydrolase [Phycicoccus sp. MAQZ13P-2]|uniref:alpha/beta hydrolase family protein n=1 Tax=Phycicoccus mangrovi TaxID=2840470 RepID=UPI001C00106D|nr:alpha/beta hydrolase [Phycicoccus mangrovi]MBT9254671.1 alpha/beta hydrolase [Phycicoccus mangrovi]MBT9273124.1 alpha/beta hydrolase [Phycicoccus mangrovi]
MTARPGRRVVVTAALGVPFLAAGCSASTTGGDDAPEGPAPERITYGPHEAQFAELTRPTSRSRGVVVVLHGGFWLAEYDISLARPLAADLVRRGWTALAVEYRRVGDGGGVPATLDDVSAALDLLADRGLADGPVVTLGHSAGGQLAVWSAARRRLERWRGAQVVPTHVVSQAGVLDLRTAADEDLGGGAVPGFLGGSPQERPEAYAWADPVALVPVEAPVWCVHGPDDGTVPIAQSQAYVRAALATGGAATLVEVPGDHLDQVDTGSDAWARTVAVLDGL